MSFVTCLADVLNVFVNQNLEIPLPAPLDLELFQVNKKYFRAKKEVLLEILVNFLISCWDWGKFSGSSVAAVTSHLSPNRGNLSREQTSRSSSVTAHSPGYNNTFPGQISSCFCINHCKVAPSLSQLCVAVAGCFLYQNEMRVFTVYISIFSGRFRFCWCLSLESENAFLEFKF